MSSRNVLFLFPPWIPGASQGPYLAPHLLSTILRTQGFSVTNIDLNLRMVKELGTNSDFLKKLIEHTQTKVTSTTETEMLLGYASVALEKLERNEKPHVLENIILSETIKRIYFQETKTIQDYKTEGLKTLPSIIDVFEQLLSDLDFSESVVCISCAFGEQLPFALDCARFIRKINPKAKILIGGAQISLLPQELVEELIRFKLFNVIFIGYAEDKIAEVISSCPEDFCTEVTNGSAFSSKMLDEIPETEFDNMEEYHFPAIPVLVNKGCYWGKCSFCDYTLMGDLGGLRYVSRSVEKVFTEIKNLRRKYPRQMIGLISDAVPPKFYKELCQRANQENFPLRTLSYMINNKNLTEEFFQEASKAQVAKIVFGTESFSDRILRLMKKQASREDILQNLELVKKYDLNVTVNLIPNYPTTTYEEALDSVALVDHYKNVISSITSFRFYLSANTEMDKNPQDYDLEINDLAPYTKDESNGYHSKNFSVKKSMTPAQEERVYSYLRRLQIECRKNYRRRDFRKKLKEFGLEKLIVSDNFNFHQLKNRFHIVSLIERIRLEVPVEEEAIIAELVKNKEIPKSLLSQKSESWFEDYYVVSLFDFNFAENDYLTDTSTRV